MTQRLIIHPDNPQQRLLQQAVTVLRSGGVIAYPTDSAYALGCHMGDKLAIERIRKLRQLDKHHNFTLVCRDLAEIASYARIDNPTFRFLKAYTPGPFTFILPATSEVPKRLQQPKRKTIGIRVPDHAIVQGLLALLGEPFMSVTLVLPGDAYPLADPEVIAERLVNQIDCLIDGGNCSLELTTVVDLVTGEPNITRQGQGQL